jgi:hypothetical protein
MYVYSLELIHSLPRSANMILVEWPPMVISKPTNFWKSLSMHSTVPSMTVYASRSERCKSKKNLCWLVIGMETHCCPARWNALEAVLFFVTVQTKSQWPEKYWRDPRMGYVMDV